MQITGKDIILYILNNNLVDEVFINPLVIHSLKYHLLSTEEAAVKLGIGTNSLLEMYKLKLIPGFKIDDEIYFNKDVKLPS